jgi:hypothetical protein
MHGPLNVKHSASVTKTSKSVLYREKALYFPENPTKTLMNYVERKYNFLISSLVVSIVTTCKHDRNYS